MSQDISQVKSLIEKAVEILVLLPQNPGPDSIASALGLFLCLESTGKQVHIACSTPLDFNEYPLKRSEAITQKIGNKNLVISLKVDSRDSVDKVSYNLDEERKVFNLIVTPKKGATPLTSDAVSYSLAGVRADLIFIVGASSFDDLGSIYSAEPALFTETPTVAINRVEPVPFALHHLANPESSSIAEFIVEIANSLDLKLSLEAATNLLAAIDVVTDKLQLTSVTASTFDTVAKLIRTGGTRIMLNRPAATQNEEITVNPSPAAEVSTPEPSPEDVPRDWLAPKIYTAPKSAGK